MKQFERPSEETLHETSRLSKGFLTTFMNTFMKHGQCKRKNARQRKQGRWKKH